LRQIEAPLVRRFTGTLEIGFSIGMMADLNVNALLKRFLSFALKTDSEFRILPLAGENQSIAWSNGIPTSKEGIDLYFQHNNVKDEVRGRIYVYGKIDWTDERHEFHLSHLPKQGEFLHKPSRPP
jgi:hypothetical protein